MSALLLTVFVGIVLVSFFVGLFLQETARDRGSSERDALLPLAPEGATPAKPPVRPAPTPPPIFP